jgi:hypothetical protein
LQTQREDSNSKNVVDLKYEAATPPAARGGGGGARPLICPDEFFSWQQLETEPVDETKPDWVVFVFGGGPLNCVSDFSVAVRFESWVSGSEFDADCQF